MYDKTHEQLKWRAAIKRYDTTRTLSDEQVELLIEAARMAPTSFGLQPIKVYIVSDESKKKELRAAGFDQTQFTEASHIFVFTARTELTEQDVEAYMERIQAQRNQTSDDVDGQRQMISGSVNSKSTHEQHEWSARQAYLALGFTLAVAAVNEIDTSPMEGFNPDKVDEIIGAADEGFHSVAVMAAGYRSDEDKYSKMPKVRKQRTEFTTKM